MISSRALGGAYGFGILLFLVGIVLIGLNLMSDYGANGGILLIAGATLIFGSKAAAAIVRRGTRS